MGYHTGKPIEGVIYCLILKVFRRVYKGKGLYARRLLKTGIEKALEVSKMLNSLALLVLKFEMQQEGLNGVNR